MKIDKSKLLDLNEYTFEKDKELDRMFDFADVKIEIAKVFINYRRENNLTQKEMANFLSINQSMVAKLEHGDYNPSLKFLFDISYKLTNDASFFIEIINKIKEVLYIKDNKIKIYQNQDLPKLMVSEDNEEYRYD